MDNAHSQARAQLDTITALVAAYNVDFDRLDELRAERGDLATDAEQAAKDYDALAEDHVTSTTVAKHADRLDMTMHLLREWDSENMDELRKLQEQANGYESQEDVEQAMQEHPLYTQANADKCPSARYVGGISRWLCECSAPAEREGVKAAADRYIFTRDEHMKGRCTHDQFYGQFLTQGYVDKVAGQIGTRRITDSICPHFNDIPLAEWDQCHIFSTTAVAMRAAGNPPTLSDVVCLAKAAAKRIRRENADPRKWAIKVRYRLVGSNTGLQHFETLATGTVDGILDYYMAGPINIGGTVDVIANVVGVDFTPA